ncbi:MAG: alanine/glycine:cation symporter family protein [Anaerovoracaceae bacterium]|jgi:AGCS family alanine or glycine:cation symporter
MTSFVNFVNDFDALMWGLPLIVILLGTHIFATFRTGFIQRKVFLGIKLSVTPAPGEGGEGEVSGFGALATALAGTIGTGNIIGVATAFSLGGPGAVLWTWLSGLLGMATSYLENMMAVRYRERTEDGRFIGGAMYACEKGLHAKWLGVLFAFFAMIAAFGIGCMTQANSISTALNQNFHIPTWVAAVLVAVLTAIVIIGGVKSIVNVTTKIVPFMAAFYIVSCIVILVLNGGAVGQAIVLICKSAFSMQSGTAGLAGFTVAKAMRYGIARGLFSNEAGMGSSPIVAASARTPNPVRQALVIMTGPFWDTVVICALTGITLVSSAIAHPEFLTGGDDTVLTFKCFELIPVVGRPCIAIALALFAFSTILGWEYYGEKSAEYLFGVKAVNPYKVLWIIFAFIGCIIKLDFVFTVSDILNGLMIIPNVICVWALSNGLMQESKKFLNNVDAPAGEGDFI